MNELLYQIALTQVKGVGAIMARHLISHLGSASAIFNESRKNLLRIDGVGAALVNEIGSKEVFRKAETEISFIEKNKIQPFFITDTNYPTRLRECSDAPVVMYMKGNGLPDRRKVISIVGTRSITHYGREMTEKLVAQLAEHLDDVLIVSGLAFGVDIVAHRSALANGLPTIGILAHGLDRIYPSEHRRTAIEMLTNGGLLTEFPSETRPDRQNFVMRNRIVAGLADVTVVIESAEKGGSLITAEIANSYNREVCAIPGRVGDVYSCGCNKLIQRNKAAMVYGAEDLIELMNWDLPKNTKENGPIQRTLFVEMTSNEEKVMNTLRKHDSLQIDEIAFRTGFAVYILSAILLDLEFKGVVKVMPGGNYRALDQ